MIKWEILSSEISLSLNPKVHSLPYAATVVAAALYILCQEDPVFQPFGLWFNMYMLWGYSAVLDQTSRDEETRNHLLSLTHLLL